MKNGVGLKTEGEFVTAIRNANTAHKTKTSEKKKPATDVIDLDLKANLVKFTFFSLSINI